MSKPWVGGTKSSSKPITNAFASRVLPSGSKTPAPPKPTGIMAKPLKRMQRERGK